MGVEKVNFSSAHAFTKIIMHHQKKGLSSMDNLSFLVAV